MRRMTSLSATSKRHEGRAKLRLPCRVQAQDLELSATVIDLSLNGAGISMPHLPFGFDASKLRHITIDGIGGFDVVYRWKTSNRLGVSFKSAHTASNRIKAYFDANGIVPTTD